MTHPFIQLSHPDLADTVSSLRRAGDDLERRRAVTERRVGDLLDGGWSGAAARAYVEGWEEWRLGCAVALRALRTVTVLVVEAGADLDDAEKAARSALGSLTGRMVERLG